MRIIDVRGFGLSSPYGSRRALGHPLNLKSLGVVELKTSDGLSGLGETYAGVYAPELVGPCASWLKPFLVGQDSSDIAGIRARLEALPFLGRNGLLASVASAIDCALWDIAGKRAGAPVWKLLNPRGRGRVRLYASGGSSVFSPREVADDAKAALDQGYGAFKMRVGHQSWTSDLRRVEAARKTLAKAELMIDAIMGSLSPPWDAVVAASRARDLERFGPAWLEEPLHPSDLEGHKALARRCRVPLATGEALTGRLEIMEYLRSGALSFFQPDATHSGGITALREHVAEARRRKIGVALHVWGGAAAIAANAHAALAYSADYLEIPMMNLEITRAMWASPLDIRGGWLYAPREPGLGVRLTEAARRRYRLVEGSGYRL